MNRTYYGLRKLNGTQFYLREDAILEKRRELENSLDGEDYLYTDGFVKSCLFGEEIKSNNQVEGYADDLESIKRAIENAESIKNPEQKARIINLYKAYNYILNGREIDKYSIRELYSITSKDLLDERDASRMGDYYRSAAVYILHNGRLDDSYDLGIPHEQIDNFMDAYLNFVNTELVGTESIEYIKSQIMHFYFVYIHPYFDVNGRTSRTLAMWYLLNKKALPYIIFNRGISFKGSLYDRTIAKSIKTNDMTYFIDLMLETLQVELEKEYVIHMISQSNCRELDYIDYQTILYFLSMRGLKTVCDMAEMYNQFNEHKKVLDFYKTRVVPLLDKGVLDVAYETKKCISGMNNKVLTLRPLDIEPEKVKHLKI